MLRVRISRVLDAIEMRIRCFNGKQQQQQPDELMYTISTLTLFVAVVVVVFVVGFACELSIQMYI